MRAPVYLAVGLLAGLVPGAAGGATLDARVVAAIEAHVEERLGGDAEATVTLVGWPTVQPPGSGEPRVVHVSTDPSARVGQVLRAMVRLEWPGRRTRFVHATCDVHVVATHWRTVRAVRRAAVVTSDDVERVAADVGRLALRPLPLAVVGGKMRRALAGGEVIAGSDVAPLPLVASGETVVVRVALNGLAVEGRAVASQTGQMGEVIRVVNADSGRALRARVVGRGQVEVVHATRNERR